MSKTIGAFVAIAVILAAVVGIAINNKNKDSDDQSSKNQAVTITGAGSTFAAPLYGQLGSEYKNKTNTTINYQAIGSGAGIAQFIANTVNYGATDVALKDSEIAQAKANGTPLNIPVAFGAVTVAYNIPGVEGGLKLDGPTIANIYLGNITNWNDPAIASLNPDVELPDLQIVPVHRSDGSGTTELFTQFLAEVSPKWAQQVGTDKSVKWPKGTGSKGNDGVAATISQTKGSIGYVELAYALQNKFPTAAIKDKAGQYVTPSLETTSKAGENLPNLSDDLRFTAINSPNPGAYPIASATFIVVYQDVCEAGAVKGSDQAQALKGWLDYLLGPGQESMKRLEYAPLPATLQAKAQSKVDSMTCNGNKITVE